MNESANYKVGGGLVTIKYDPSIFKKRDVEELVSKTAYELEANCRKVKEKTTIRVFKNPHLPYGSYEDERE